MTSCLNFSDLADRKIHEIGPTFAKISLHDRSYQDQISQDTIPQDKCPRKFPRQNPPVYFIIWKSKINQLNISAYTLSNVSCTSMGPLLKCIFCNFSQSSALWRIGPTFAKISLHDRSYQDQISQDTIPQDKCPRKFSGQNPPVYFIMWKSKTNQLNISAYTLSNVSCTSLEPLLECIFCNFSQSSALSDPNDSLR